jgi:hypothetical protein
MMSTQQRSPNCLWAYAYEIVPPQPSKRLDRIRALLEGENLAAVNGAGAWAGRLILEHRVTHILIISDTPVHNRGINCSLETELERLHAEFSVTEPVAVPSASDPPAEHATAGGNGH